MKHRAKRFWSMASLLLLSSHASARDDDNPDSACIDHFNDHGWAPSGCGEVIVVTGKPEVSCLPGRVPTPDGDCVERPAPRDQEPGTRDEPSGPAGGGGGGTKPPPIPPCDRCRQQAKQCSETASDSIDRCVDFLTDYASDLCKRKVGIDGKPPPTRNECKPCMEWLGWRTSPAPGQPPQCDEQADPGCTRRYYQELQFCSGNPTTCVDRTRHYCMDGWLDGLPQSSSTTQQSIKIEAGALGLGGSASQTVTWNAREGLRNACVQLAAQLGTQCQVKLNACLNSNSCKLTGGRADQ